jgi:N-acetylglucosaminyldiphosphoundecaprenol N-acetyl-beta-D-mannosaminyltransferase
MSQPGLPRDARIFGIPVHGRSTEAVLREIDENIRVARSPAWISITSSELLYNARRSTFLPDYIRGARLSLADSISVTIAAALHGRAIRRFPGPALMEECCRYGVERGWRHFFCGGAEGVAELLAARLTERFPGLLTAGTYCPPFRSLQPDEETAMIARINDASPDLLWIGLGVVKQEAWIARHFEALRVPWVIGVGGAFDFHAGTVQRAPDWMQRAGLEWAFRLYQEPWRFKRISSSFVFLLEAALDALLGRAPILGGAHRKDKPPAWRGKRST